MTDGGNAARGPSGPLRRRSSKSGENRGPATLALSTQLQLRRRLLAGAGIITAIAVLAMVGAFVASKRVVGDSMSPTIGHGDRILTDPFTSPPDRFDLVVVRLDGNAESVKRVIGLPGDTIEIAGSGDGSPPVVRVRPNGDDEWRHVTGPGLDDRWTGTPEGCCLPDGTSSPAGTGPQVVPDGHVFVLGDNPQHSADSRRFGWIADDAVVGVARWRVWPPGAAGGLGGGDYDFQG